jgi:hypothetical protein
MALSYSLDLFVPKTPLTTGGGEEIVAQEQVKAMNWAVLKAKGEIVPRVPGNTGLSRKSIQTKIAGEKVELTGRVFSPLGHMLALEGGAHWPGPWPPVGPLRLWAERRFGVDEGEARSIAFLVARKLKRKGMTGRYFFKAGYEACKGAIEANWATSLLKIKVRLMGGK